jgi:hypothetical protein
VIRAWWSLRSLLAVRWLVDHGFDPSAPTCEVEVLRSGFEAAQARRLRVPFCRNERGHFREDVPPGVQGRLRANPMACVGLEPIFNVTAHRSP